MAQNLAQWFLMLFRHCEWVCQSVYLSFCQSDRQSVRCNFSNKFCCISLIATLSLLSCFCSKKWFLIKECAVWMRSPSSQKQFTHHHGWNIFSTYTNIFSLSSIQTLKLSNQLIRFCGEHMSHVSMKRLNIIGIL